MAYLLLFKGIVTEKLGQTGSGTTGIHKGHSFNIPNPISIEKKKSNHCAREQGRYRSLISGPKGLNKFFRTLSYKFLDYN